MFILRHGGRAGAPCVCNAMANLPEGNFFPVYWGENPAQVATSKNHPVAKSGVRTVSVDVLKPSRGALIYNPALILMQTDLDFLSLIVDATFVVQLVMLILLLASVVSWSFIFNKWRELEGMKAKADAFEARFWSGEDVSRLYENLRQEGEETGMAAIFCEGFREYMRLREDSALSVEMISSTSVKVMKVALSREIDRMESQLNFLATVGSTAPYIGLFGTVWGIMDAFLALRNVQYATLSLVAPGIAEALIATAMGLFAAIPAVIAYNRFRDRSERLISRFDNFLEEFTTLLSKQVPGAARATGA